MPGTALYIITQTTIFIHFIWTAFTHNTSRIQQRQNQSSKYVGIFLLQTAPHSSLQATSSIKPIRQVCRLMYSEMGCFWQNCPKLINRFQFPYTICTITPHKNQNIFLSSPLLCPTAPGAIGKSRYFSSPQKNSTNHYSQSPIGQ
jgi:hypothetical protein